MKTIILCQWCNNTGIEPEKRLWWSRSVYSVLRPARPCPCCDPEGYSRWKANQKGD